MQKLLISGLTLAVACAGSSPTPGASPEAEQHVVVVGGTGTGASGSGGGASLNVVPSSGLSTKQLAAPIDQVWKVLPAVLDSISLPVGLLDPRTHIIGNRGFHLRGRLGKTPLGRYIDCGTTQIGPNAESYDITLTVTVALTERPGSTTAMTTDVEASAKPLAFAESPFPCTTKGNLEKRIIDLTAALISR